MGGSVADAAVPDQDGGRSDDDPHDERFVHDVRGDVFGRAVHSLRGWLLVCRCT